MNIRGFIRFSLIDFPGKIACVIFVGNCNFRCPYCHNPHLVFDPESQPHISEENFLNFLEGRKGKLDGVVISGGEPSLRLGLKKFAEKIKAKGFAIKLDTNGSIPEVVIKAHRRGLIDYLGVDYKGSVANYCEIANYSKKINLAQRVHKTIGYAVKNNIPIDVRTTVHKKLLPPEELNKMRSELDGIGIREWTLQQFNPVDIIDDDLAAEPTYSDSELVKLASSLGKSTRVRGLSGLFIDQ